MNFLDKGQRVKEFTVESIISSNGYYEAYKLIDENNTPYFLKIYDFINTPKELIYDNKEIMEFLNCMDLSHRNIIEFIDIGKISAADKKYHYMITKFYGGEVLGDYINRNGKLSTAESVTIMKGVLDGVLYMHNNGIIHNKLNPSNIIINTNHIPTIFDLGNSCREGNGKCKYSIANEDKFYLANETFDGVHSKQSDTFSLVAIFYKLVTGETPWFVNDIKERDHVLVIQNILHDLSQKGIDEKLKNIFEKGLSLDRTTRYQNVNELIHDMMQLSGIDTTVSTKKHRVDAQEKNEKEEKSSTLIEPTKPKGNGFADIAGMSVLKENLRKKVLFWLKNKEQAHKYKITLPNGMLLYGPPGCGKTFFAEKFAEEAGFNFIMVKASDIASTYIHGTQEKIAALFDSAQKAQPSILCFDEFDAVVPERTDMMQQTSGEVNEFLSQMNNCGHRGIFVIATSNRPDKIDPAVLRTGRIDKLIYIPMPDEDARYEMFKLHLKDRPTAEIDLHRFAKETEGYIASDIAYIVNDAAMNAGLQNIPINEGLIEISLKQTPPSVRPDVVKQYERVRDALQGTGINRRIPQIGFTVDRYR
ncbi:MAG: AAA family ATPase [Prevotella sp.]|nr:AAA family ATPase [Prevotella sp.]